MNIEELAVGTSLDITGFLLPWASMLLSIIIALMIKDWATSFAKGLKFKMNREFNPGDVVLLDGEEAAAGAGCEGRAVVCCWSFEDADGAASSVVGVA